MNFHVCLLIMSNELGGVSSTMQDDTLAVSRILHVPALYWTNDDGDLRHSKYKAVIDTINAGITNFNKEKGSPHRPNLQRTGQRRLGKGDRRKYIFSRYRENIHMNMMHFADKYRIDCSSILRSGLPQWLTILTSKFKHPLTHAFKFICKFCCTLHLLACASLLTYALFCSSTH